MFAYWLLYLSPALLALVLPDRFRHSKPLWLAFALLIVLLVGLRDEVGCDWMSYALNFEYAADQSLWYLLQLSDPGYEFLNWFASRMGWGVYGTNTLGAAIFTTGLFIFCRAQPNPWLAVAVAIPYLVVVVAMGYTRQAVALGFVFWGLSAMERRDLVRFLILVSLATLFHKTAVLMIPLGLFLFGRGWAARATAVLLAGFGLWAAFLADYQYELWENYIEADMRSHGARVRILMNVIPAVLLLAFWRRWKSVYPASRIWFWLALGALACLPLLALSSTATDRIALYITPIQVVVLSRLPYMARSPRSNKLLTAGVLAGYAAVLYVWLNYARHAFCWVPYNNTLF